MPNRPKAYHSQDFINSREGRTLRILSEYMEPKVRFAQHNVADTIVFMGSARFKSREDAEAMVAAAKEGNGDLIAAENAMEMSVYYEAARELAFRFTKWSDALRTPSNRYVVCTGGGPGIMEAANRGAAEAGGLNIGLTISLPFEEFDNPHITPDLHFHFHYFFMRKFWFTYLAKAFIIMPGGFGTMDELFEILTLVQTRKMRKPIPIVLYGTKYWGEVINLDALARYGTISPDDLKLFHRSDSVADTFAYVTKALSQHPPESGAVL
jgi:hypothetical protein